MSFHQSKIYTNSSQRFSHTSLRDRTCPPLPWHVRPPGAGKPLAWLVHHRRISRFGGEKPKGTNTFLIKLQLVACTLFVLERSRPGLGAEEKRRSTIAKAEEMAKLFM